MSEQLSIPQIQLSKHHPTRQLHRQLSFSRSLSRSRSLSVFFPMKLSFSNTIIHYHYTYHKPQPLPLPFPPVVKLACLRPPRGVRMDSSSPASTVRLQKDKIVVVIGATGCGKTRVSIDLATRFHSEIINSDKMQVYNGLDITTNKVSIHERQGVPHLLLGEFDPEDGELTASEFRLAGGLAISEIVSRQKLPIVVGGSNSFIHALVVDQFNPELDVFHGLNPVSTQLRYNCCFLWVDVSLPVLCNYLCQRVDEMLESGMFEELSEYYHSFDSASHAGLGKAIGVPEFDRYFKKYPPGPGVWRGGEWDRVRRREYEEAVRQIKENTCQLAKRQMGKILRFKGAGWDLQRVDATEAFRELMTMTSDCGQNNNINNNDNNNNNSNTDSNNINKKKRCKKKKKKKARWMDIWERDVMEPSVKIVKRFLVE